MEIKTKYEIGQKLFWIRKDENLYRIFYSPIKTINIGGKTWEEYEVGNGTRSERDLYESFDDAKKACIEMQKATNERLLKEVCEYKEEKIIKNFTN